MNKIKKGENEPEGSQSDDQTRRAAPPDSDTHGKGEGLGFGRRRR